VCNARDPQAQTQTRIMRSSKEKFKCKLLAHCHYACGRISNDQAISSTITGLTFLFLGKFLEIGKGRILREGTRVAILSLGARLGEALKAAGELEKQGISATVADARFAKPLDVDLIRRLATGHEVLITIEEGASGGQLGAGCSRRLWRCRCTHVTAYDLLPPGL